MILLAQTRIDISKSAEVLFAYATNMENYGKWFPGVVSISSHNDLPHGQLGKTYQELINMPEGEVSLIIEVKQSELNKTFYTEGNLEPLRPAMLMEFEPTGQNTTLFNLQYFSRNEQLAGRSELLNSIKTNLAERIIIAANNLQKHFSE